jgi:hypothetical protein
MQRLAASQFESPKAHPRRVWRDFGALSAWGTIAKSNYHGFSASLRQRIHNLPWDFNYTYSHSLHNASGLQADPNNTTL